MQCEAHLLGLAEEGVNGSIDAGYGCGEGCTGERDGGDKSEGGGNSVKLHSVTPLNWKGFHFPDLCFWFSPGLSAMVQRSSLHEAIRSGSQIGSIYLQKEFLGVRRFFCTKFFCERCVIHK
jgi:hypothetical protein